MAKDLDKWHCIGFHVVTMSRCNKGYTEIGSAKGLSHYGIKFFLPGIVVVKIVWKVLFEVVNHVVHRVAIEQKERGIVSYTF